MNTGWTMIWNYALPKERNVSARTPVIGKDQVVGVFHYDKKSFFESSVIALSKTDGREVWRHTIDHVATEPLIDNHGNIYVASFAGAVHAYAPDGSTLWTSAFGTRNVNVPVLSGDRIFIAETGGGSQKTWCLDKATGDVLWSHDTGGHAYRFLAHDGKIFHTAIVSGAKFGESTVHLLCIDQQSGNRLWSTTADQYHFNAAIVDGLLVWGARNAIHLYDPTNGALKASLAIPEGTAITSGPLVVGNRIIAGDDNSTIRVASLEKKGLLFKKPQLEAVWSQPLQGEIVGQPLYHQGQIFVLDDKGQIVGLDIDGTITMPTFGVGDGKCKGGGLAGENNLLAVATGRTVELYQN